MKKLLLASALTALTFTAAQAADAVVYEPAPEVSIASSAYDWSGGYIGAQAGYAWGESRYSNGSNERINYAPDVFIGGFYGGYNYQFASGIIVGADADINFSGTDGNGEFFYNNSSNRDPYHVANSKMQYSGALRARLGYAMDRWMPYVAGGLSTSKYKFDLEQPGNHKDFSESKVLTGWNIGGGVEYAATNNILIRSEYRYSNFGSKSFDHGNGFGGGAKIDLKAHDIRFGIAYKF